MRVFDETGELGLKAFAVVKMQREKQAGFSLSRAEKQVLLVSLKTISGTQKSLNWYARNAV